MSQCLISVHSYVCSQLAHFDPYAFKRSLILLHVKGHLHGNICLVVFKFKLIVIQPLIILVGKLMPLPFKMFS